MRRTMTKSTSPHIPANLQVLRPPSRKQTSELLNHNINSVFIFHLQLSRKSQIKRRVYYLLWRIVPVDAFSIVEES